MEKFLALLQNPGWVSLPASSFFYSLPNWPLCSSEPQVQTPLGEPGRQSLGSDPVGALWPACQMPTGCWSYPLNSPPRPWSGVPRTSSESSQKLPALHALSRPCGAPTIFQDLLGTSNINRYKTITRCLKSSQSDRQFYNTISFF